MSVRVIRSGLKSLNELYREPSIAASIETKPFSSTTADRYIFVPLARDENTRTDNANSLKIQILITFIANNRLAKSERQLAINCNTVI
jgi:hypothetical protein